MTTRYNNYIHGDNPFNLAGPPEEFLRSLAIFDASLVVIPSKQGFFYRLCQRRPARVATDLVNHVMREQGDTITLASHSLVPVTTILATANWYNPLLFQELAERAPWRQGGAEKVMKHIEDAEFATDMNKRKAVEQNITDRAKDGWRLYQYKTGQRVSRADHNRAVNVPAKRPVQFGLT